MIRIVVSAITDIRAVEKMLKAHDVAYTVDQRSMGSSSEREAFTTLKARHQWPSLPMIFADDAFIGGEPELQVYLASTRADQCTTARYLGIGGLLPFLALAFAAIANVDLPGIAAIPALLAYAATILSFIGAVHWGIALQETDHATRNKLFVASVVPALAAWLALLLPATFALIVFITAFSGWYLWERLTIWNLYPRWFAELRTLLTTVVTLTLTLTAALA